MLGSATGYTSFGANADPAVEELDPDWMRFRYARVAAAVATSTAAQKDPKSDTLPGVAEELAVGSVASGGGFCSLTEPEVWLAGSAPDPDDLDGPPLKWEDSPAGYNAIPALSPTCACVNSAMPRPECGFIPCTTNVKAFKTKAMIDTIRAARKGCPALTTWNCHQLHNAGGHDNVENGVTQNMNCGGLRDLALSADPMVLVMLALAVTVVGLLGLRWWRRRKKPEDAGRGAAEQELAVLGHKGAPPPGRDGPGG